MNILIVDDDTGTCDTLSVALRKMGGHDVSTALTAAAAMMIADSQGFNAIVVDQRLGEVNGLELLAALRQTRSKHAAVYVFTAWGTIRDAVEAIRRGAADYLEKDAVGVEQLLKMFGTTPTPMVPKDQRIRLVLTMIDANPVIDSAKLADLVDLSVSRMRALFKAEAGVALKAHQRDARLARAAFLIETSDRRISDIAFTLGFQDLKWFEQRFRRCIGCAPSEYRQSKRPH